MNELVKLIKSLLKIIFATLILFGLGLSSVVGWKYYQEQKIFMIALECFWEETSGGIKNDTRYYLIKKQRNKILPHGLYRGAHRKDAIINEDIFMQSSLTDSNENFYYFGINADKQPSKTSYGHIIDRKNLNMSYWHGKNYNWTNATCIEISENKFYKKIKEKIDFKNSGNVF